MPAKVIITGAFERPDENDFSGIAIPFEITYTNGAAVIRACAELEKTALEFAARFAGSEFSPEAETWLSCMTAPFLKLNGLERSEECGRLLILKFSGRNDSDKRIIYTQALLFDPDAGYENLTSFDLSWSAELGIPVFVSLDGNKIVSAAVGSSCGNGADSMEIGVETAEGYTGRGLATSCVRALALELRGRGLDTFYLAQEDNPASVSVACGAGFKEYGKIFQMICRECGP